MGLIFRGIHSNLQHWQYSDSQMDDSVLEGRRNRAKPSSLDDSESSQVYLSTVLNTMTEDPGLYIIFISLTRFASETLSLGLMRYDIASVLEPFLAEHTFVGASRNKQAEGGYPSYLPAEAPI